MNNRPFKVYLAGKMGGRPGCDVLDERRYAVETVKSFDMWPVDPAAGENIAYDVTPVDMSMDYITMQSFVSKDEYAISHCDALLVLTGDTPSEGTGWEMGLAHFKLGIPIVMVSPARVNGKLMGFSNIKVQAIFSTVEDAAEYLSDNYAEA